MWKNNPNAALHTAIDKMWKKKEWTNEMDFLLLLQLHCHYWCTHRDSVRQMNFSNPKWTNERLNIRMWIECEIFIYPLSSKISMNLNSMLQYAWYALQLTRTEFNCRLRELAREWANTICNAMWLRYIKLAIINAFFLYATLRSLLCNSPGVPHTASILYSSHFVKRKKQHS